MLPIPQSSQNALLAAISQRESVVSALRKAYPIHVVAFRRTFSSIGSLARIHRDTLVHVLLLELLLPFPRITTKKIV